MNKKSNYYGDKEQEIIWSISCQQSMPVDKKRNKSSLSSFNIVGSISTPQEGHYERSEDLCTSKRHYRNFREGACAPKR